MVGVARVARQAYPDPTAREGSWLAADLEPVKALATPVALAEVKADASLRGDPARPPVAALGDAAPAAAFERILALGKTKVR